MDVFQLFPLLKQPCSNSEVFIPKFPFLLQFPIVLAKIWTGHKLQGQTLKTVVLGNIGHHVNGNSGWLYVILFKVTTIDGFHTLVRVPGDPSSYNAKTVIDEEMTRLCILQEGYVTKVNIETTTSYSSYAKS